MASILSKKQRQKHKSTKLSDLKTLGHDLLSSRAHVNNLPKLLSFVSPTSPPQFVLESLLSLQAFFTPLLPDLPSSSSKPSASNASQDDPDFIYRTWLRSKFDELVESLIQVLLSPQSDETLKEVVLDTIMEFVKSGNGGRFHSAIYHRLLRSIVHSTTPANFLLDLLASKYFKYIDVRYFTYISLEKLSRVLDAKDISDDRNLNTDCNDGGHPSESMDLLIHKIHYIMSHIPSLEASVEKTDYDMWSGSGDDEDISGNLKAENKQHMTEKHNDKVLTAASIAKKMKLKFTKAWLSFLRLPLPLDVYKEVLATLHQAVIPYLSNPVLLCDFLTRSYDIGGVISVMALSGLFILMTQYGLEYPNFYEKLYALLVPSIFMAKHRSKFFQLVDACLKSPLLPAYLAAAFAKKLSRLSISVPPSGALVIIALVHNLLRRHPSINCLVNRGGGGATVKDDPETEQRVADGVNDTATASADKSVKKPGIDPFDNEQSDPIKSNAMRSSLWEIDTLRHHYCPAVSRFVLSLENDLTVRAKTTEISVGDFSSGSYATIFGEQMRRRIKLAPLAYYKVPPTSLLSESESEFLGWTFKCEDSKRKNDINDENGKIDQDCNHNSVKRQRVECS
ncbi:nucleolar complex protein 4 homolog B [Prunus avium]|uniref:Nucleolar complex protein 4 homolog B n=1 Tax=Prunus avium TaxID=42229 RepID=A0A6P5SAN2_PRUAV|nr:nucleolar complex protein 4 homolog B [Prunus avium]